MQEHSQDLLDRISELRDKLNKTVHIYGLKSTHTIKVSEALDILINQYHQLEIE